MLFVAYWLPFVAKSTSQNHRCFIASQTTLLSCSSCVCFDFGFFSALSLPVAHKELWSAEESTVGVDADVNALLAGSQATGIDLRVIRRQDTRQAFESSDSGSDFGVSNTLRRKSLQVQWRIHLFVGVLPQHCW